MEYPGIDGFLGTRASVMLDVVFLAMFAVIPVMAGSIYQVKFKRKFRTHKAIQLALGAVLLVTVTAFEIDMRFISGWRERAQPSPYYSELWYEGAAQWALAIHLVFAVTTALLWVHVIVQALRKIPRPPRPCEYSGRHKVWGRLAAADMVLTSVSGWVFYWLAFVAT